MYVLTIRTDYDFGVRFRGRSYGDYTITLTLNSVEELEDIELLGPFGSSSIPTKTWEWYDAMQKIKANPEETLNDYGGNRGVSWYPIVHKKIPQ